MPYVHLGRCIDWASRPCADIISSMAIPYADKQQILAELTRLQAYVRRQELLRGPGRDGGSISTLLDLAGFLPEGKVGEGLREVGKDMACFHSQFLLVWWPSIGVPAKIL